METQPVVVITGATNGLGRLAALDLARGGAQLGLVARSPQKADALRREIEQAAPGTPVDVFRADLSLLADVARVGRQIDAHYPRIDVLINNAGVHAFSQRVTSEGFAEMTAVNYLAPWLLTDILRDKITASTPARIVTVASQSSGHTGELNVRQDLVDTADYTRRESSTVYGRTKLMDIMFTQELGRQLAGTGVAVTCCAPGFNVTGLGRDLPLAGALEKILTVLHVGDPRHGCRDHRAARDRPRLRRQHGRLLRRQDRRAPGVPGGRPGRDDPACSVGRHGRTPPRHPAPQRRVRCGSGS